MIIKAWYSKSTDETDRSRNSPLLLLIVKEEEFNDSADRSICNVVCWYENDDEYHVPFAMQLKQMSGSAAHQRTQQPNSFSSSSSRVLKF